MVTFERKLGLTFFVIFIGLVITGIITYKSNQGYIDSNRLVVHTQDILREANVTLALAKDLGGERAYLSTGDPEFLENFNNAEKSVFEHIGILKDLTKDNSRQQARIDSLRAFAKRRIDLVNKCVMLISQGKKDEASTLIESKQGKHIIDDFRAVIAAMESEEAGLLEQRRAENQNSLLRLDRILMVLFGLLLFLVAGTFIAVRYNLAKRVTLEKEVKQNNRFLSAILENLPNMIFVKDAEHFRFIRFNKAGEKLLGQNRDLLIGKNDYDFFPKDQADFFTAKDKEVIHKGELLDIPEEPIQTAIGQRWLHTKKIPITDETGKPLYLLGISEDITERKDNLDEIKQLNKELEKTINQLTLANKEMEAFTYSVSHDLRAPLRIIDGFSEILVKDYQDKLDDEAIHTLNVIMSNAKHMGQLIDDLLNLSRLGRTQLSVKHVDMMEMVGDIISAMSIMEQKVNNSVSVHYLPPANCDSSLMRQVWVNLISNAVKYSRKNENPKIDIGSITKEGETIYYVKDNGVGFEMKYAHKLFGVFQRLHKISEFEGTGVGLALVQRILLKHGGKIWVDAKLNEGATFFFSLSEPAS